MAQNWICLGKLIRMVSHVCFHKLIGKPIVVVYTAVRIV